MSAKNYPEAVLKYTVDKIKHEAAATRIDNSPASYFKYFTPFLTIPAVTAFMMVDGQPIDVPEYKLDPQEIEESYADDMNTQIAVLEDLQSERDSLDREIYIQKYDNKGAVDLELQNQRELADLKLKQAFELTAMKVLTDGAMTETGFPEYLKTLSETEVKGSHIQLSGTYNTNALKECQIQYPSGSGNLTVRASNIENCMEKATVTAEQLEKSQKGDAALAGFLGLLGGGLSSLLMVGGILGSIPKHWYRHPKFSDYKPKPKIKN